MEAKRGDLVVIETTNRTYYTARDQGVTEPPPRAYRGWMTNQGGRRWQWRVLAGLALQIHQLRGTDRSADEKRELARVGWKVSKLSIVPKSLVSVPDVLAAYAAHTWDGHATTKPLDSLDEARALVRAHAL